MKAKLNTILNFYPDPVYSALDSYVVEYLVKNPEDFTIFNGKRRLRGILRRNRNTEYEVQGKYVRVYLRKTKLVEAIKDYDKHRRIA